MQLFFSSGMELLHKNKSHLDLHIELKGRSPKEKLHPSGSPNIQVIGADAYLNNFVDLYTKKYALKESLYLCLLQGVVANISGNSAPKFPMLMYNFYFGMNCTSRKAFEFVSENLTGPALRKIQNREILNDSRIKPFIDYSKKW